MRIVITGASGFVGANLVRHFSRKHEVFAITRNPRNWRLPKNANAVVCDIQNRDNVLQMVKEAKPDVLIHCAAYGGYHFETDVRATINTNIIGSLNLIDACRDNILFINTGSSSEYGIRTEPMKESDPIRPETNYAMTKALITNLISSKAVARALTLRLFSVYGYYEEKHRLIPTVLYSVAKRQRAKLSNKNNVRDFVFVEDVAAAYELAIKNFDKVENGSVFNVGSGKQSRIIDVVNAVKADVEWAPEVRTKEPERTWQADISSIRKGLGWEPAHSLDEGLGKTLKWMEENISLYDQEKNDKYARAKGNSE